MDHPAFHNGISLPKNLPEKLEKAVLHKTHTFFDRKVSDFQFKGLERVFTLSLTENQEVDQWESESEDAMIEGLLGIAEVAFIEAQLSEPEEAVDRAVLFKTGDDQIEDQQSKPEEEIDRAVWFMTGHDAREIREVQSKLDATEVKNEPETLQVSLRQNPIEDTLQVLNAHQLRAAMRAQLPNGTSSAVAMLSEPERFKSRNDSEIMHDAIDNSQQRHQPGAVGVRQSGNQPGAVEKSQSNVEPEAAREIKSDIQPEAAEEKQHEAVEQKKPEAFEKKNSEDEDGDEHDTDASP